MDEHARTETDGQQAGPGVGQGVSPGDAAPGRLKRGRRKGRPPRRDDGTAARERMEASILDRRKATTHCPTCGALGNWETQSVKKPIRYLLCGHCRVGLTQIAVTEADVDAALGVPEGRP